MIVENDTNAIVDVFVHDRETGTTERVSLDDADAELAAPSYALDHGLAVTESIESHEWLFEWNAR